MTTTQGSCLCGEVKYAVEGDFHNFFLCHCHYCQKGTGTAHAANLFAKNAKLIWLQGEANVKSYHLQETRHIRSFCSNCGSMMPTAIAGGKLVLVPAGSLDDAITLKPTAHLFMASKADWEHDFDQVQQFQGYPE